MLLERHAKKLNMLGVRRVSVSNFFIVFLNQNPPIQLSCWANRIHIIAFQYTVNRVFFVNSEIKKIIDLFVSERSGIFLFNAKLLEIRGYVYLKSLKSPSDRPTTRQFKIPVIIVISLVSVHQYFICIMWNPLLRLNLIFRTLICSNILWQALINW